MIDQQSGHVITDQRNANVDQVPEPSSHHALAIRIQNLDERRLEELVTVECEIVGKPCTGRCDDSTAKVVEDELERLDVVAGLIDSSMLLGLFEGSGRVVHAIESVVGEPESHERHDSELHSESPLGGNFAVRWVTAAVEDQEENDEDDLVEHLAPTLHQECQNDVSSTVQFVVSLVDGCASALCLVLHRS